MEETKQTMEETKTVVTKSKKVKKSISMKKGLQKFTELQQNGNNELDNKHQSKICSACEQPVYSMEQIIAAKRVWHKTCFKCVECKKQLKSDYFENENNFYCALHYKKLLTPSAPCDDGTPLNTKMIISENTPVELPEDVIRSSHKTNIADELQNLNIKNKYKYFENLSDLNDELNNSKELDYERNSVFQQIDELKNKFENLTDVKEERRENRKQELINIRSRLFAGKQARIKEQYQQAVNESESKFQQNFENMDFDKKAKDIKSIFENGDVYKSKNRNVGRNDLEVIDCGIGKESRSIFKEMEQNSNKVPNGVPLNKSASIASIKKEATESVGEVVKSDTVPNDDVEIPTMSVSAAYKFFENSLPNKQKNVESKTLYANQLNKRETASKMINLFKEMENHRSEHATSPRPLKEFTPPRGDKTSTDDDENSDESETEDSEEDFKKEIQNDLMQTKQQARARNMRQVFENWDFDNKEKKNIENIERTIEHTKIMKEIFENQADIPVTTVKHRNVNRFV